MKTRRNTSQEEVYRSQKKGGRFVGALIGAILLAFLGAVIGAAIALDDTAGALIGGIIGAVTGALIGWTVVRPGRDELYAEEDLVSRRGETAARADLDREADMDRPIGVAANRADHRPGAKLRKVVSGLSGAFVGALVGAVIGAMVALNDTEGAVIGGIIGAILGWLLGWAMYRVGRRRADARELAAAEPGERRAKVVDRDLGDASLTRRSGPAATSASVQAAERAERSDVVRVPLAEERIEVDKRELEAGLVRLRKVVRTETVQVPVEIRREEIIVERVEAGEASAAAGDTHRIAHHEGDELVISLVREEPVIQKEAKVFSEVHVHKVTRTETENIQETVRREKVVVDRSDERNRNIQGR